MSRSRDRVQRFSVSARALEQQYPAAGEAIQTRYLEWCRLVWSLLHNFKRNKHVHPFKN
jgi:hypothetical protein